MTVNTWPPLRVQHTGQIKPGNLVLIRGSVSV
jgi:hypothetical protein